MDPKPLKLRMLYVSALTFVLVALLAVPGISATTSQEGQEAEEISEELRSAILDPVKERLLGIRDEKNAAGVKNKRGTYSTAVKKIDDETYRASMHVDTAEGNTLITKRYQMVIKKDPDESDKWVVAEEVLKDTFAGLHRSEMGFNCYPFESFSFDREGLEIYAGDAEAVTDDRPRIEYANWVRPRELNRVLPKLLALREPPPVAASAEDRAHIESSYQRLVAFYEIVLLAYARDREQWGLKREAFSRNREPNAYYDWFFGG